MSDRTTIDSADGSLLPEGEEAIVAHLVAGPFDGSDRMIRARLEYSERVRRELLRRLLRRSPRYAIYELRETWSDGALRHGRYEFTEIASSARE